MSRNSRFCVLLIITILFCLPEVFAKTESWIGKPAKSIFGRNLNGKMVYLSDYCGGRCPLEQRKITMVHFFSTSCKPCLKEIPAIKKLIETLPEEKFAVLMISVGDPAGSVIKYREEHGVKAAFILDKYGTNAKRWGVAKTNGRKTTFDLPYTFIVDGGGILREVLPGAHVDLDKIVLKKFKQLNK